MYVFPLEYIFIKDIKILSGNVLFHTLHVRIISGEKHDPIYLCLAIVQVDGRGLHLCHASQGLVL